MIVLYTTKFCGFCAAAKRLLAKRGLVFEENDVGFDSVKRVEMMQRAGGMRTVPQIFIHDRHVGGYNELAALDRDNQLEAWLANDPAALPAGILRDRSGQ